MRSMKHVMRVGSWGSWLTLGMVAACGGDPGPTSGPGWGAAGGPFVVAPATGAAGSSATTASPAGAASAGTPSVAAASAVPAPAGGPGLTTPSVPDSPVAQVPTAAANAPLSMWCGVKQTLDSNCIACHNEQKTAGAPMSLKTYDDLVAPAVSDATKKVYQMVGVRVHDAAKPMPPQQKLTTDQLSGIDAWVAAAAPAGSDPTCANAPASAPTTAAETWPTDCDASYKILSHGAGGDTQPYTVPAGQEIHPKVSVAAPWGSQSMQALAFRSITDNPKVLHHWILYGPKGEFLTGWAPGKQEIQTMGQSDVGMNLAGGMLELDMHYNNLQGTTDQPDNSGVEICVVKPEHFRKNTAAVYMGFSQFAINIPARSTNFDVTGSCTFSGTTPVTLLTASPHAHTLARHMKFTLKKASGDLIVMHDGAFDFNEQQSYTLDKPLQLESGDTVTTTCTYDNPSDRAVTFGENTGNEMCFNFATYYPMGDMNCGGFGAAPTGFMF
jgi:hypothetical protein